MDAILWFDGAKYTSHCKYAFILRVGEEEFSETGICYGTSVDAEYNAVISGLKKAIQKGVKSIHLVGDSRNVLHQITGQQRTKKTKEKLQETRKLLEHVDHFTIEWIPRAKNPAHKLF